MHKFISVVIPTFEPIYLQSTLESLRHQSYPSNMYEVIVVENPQKTDKIHRICRRYNARHVSSELGSNKARNLGIAHASGEIIALCDDDVLLSAGWLGEISEQFSKNDIGVLGGRVVPRFLDSDYPKWITSKFLQVLSIVDIDENIKIWQNNEAGHHLVSANAAFKKEYWEKSGGFNEEIGYRGNNLIPNDEVEFFFHCSSFGGINYMYSRNMSVYHIIDDTRTNLRWFRKRFYGQGVADALMIRRIVPDKDVLNIYHDDIQYVPNRNMLLVMDDVLNTRNVIQNEEVTRQYIKNLTICKTDYLIGFQNTVLNEKYWDSFL